MAKGITVIGHLSSDGVDHSEIDNSQAYEAKEGEKKCQSESHHLAVPYNYGYTD